MTIKVKISHNGKIDRAGKLTAINSDGETILHKVPVAIPKNIKLHQCVKNISPMSIVFDDELLEKANTAPQAQKDEYLNLFYQLTSFGRFGGVVVSEDIVIAPSLNFLLHNDQDSFILDNSNFGILLGALIDEKGGELVVVEKKSIDLFKRKVISFKETNVNDSFERYSRIYEELKLHVRVKNPKKLMLGIGDYYQY